MGTNRALKFIDELETLLNKTIRFNLSGPLLLQAYENDDKEINILLTHKNLTDDYLMQVRKIVDDNFNVPEADYDNLIDNMDNSILFPNFILSSKPIDFDNIDKKICSNAYLIFPRSFKMNIHNFAEKKTMNPLNDVFITKEEIYSDITGVKEKYTLNLDFNTSTDYELFNHKLKKCLLPYTAELSDVLAIEMFPSEKLKKNYPPIIRHLLEKVINGGENLLAEWNLTNENLEAYIKGLDFLYFIPPNNKDKEKHYVYIYKDLIKGKTKSSKLYPIFDEESFTTNNALVIEYNNIMQYLFYRHFDIDMFNNNESSVRGFF